MTWLDILGYAGSIVTATSLTMSNVVRLRTWNLAGALVLTVYGALVGALPVALLNGFLALVDVVHIARLRSASDAFETVEIDRADDPFVARFLARYGADIRRFFPTFELDGVTAPRIVVTLRNLVPVGLFVYQHQPDGRVVVHLDYVAPAFRDLRNARFLYGRKEAELSAEGVRELIAPAWHTGHAAYLRRVGFVTDGGLPVYRKLLAPTAA